MAKISARQTRESAAELEQLVFLQVQRTADALMRGFEEMLRPAGLSPTQYNVLRILRGAGEPGLACREIGQRMINRDPDITRLLDRLEARGLIGRQRQADDRRVIKARISRAGLDLLKSLDRPVLAAHKAQLGHLSSRKLTSLANLLEAARKTGI